MHLLRLSSLHAALATTIFLSLSLFSFQADAGRYLITVLDAKITKKKTQFKRWDTGFGSMTLPDSYVVVDIGGQRLTTTIQKNNLTPTWNISKAYTLNGNEKVYLEVRDKDGFTRDDLIGKTDVPLSQLIKNGNVAFGNVLSLRIKVLRIDKPKPRPVVRKAPVVPRPVVRKVEHAPRKVEPAPRKVEPAPRKVEPAPRKVEPAPRKVEPAPRKVEPAPRKVEPAPRKVEPAPRATAPKEDPKVAFCIGMMKFSLSCLKQQQEALKNATGAQAKTAKFLSMIIAQIEKNLQLKDKSMLISKCDAGLKRDKIKPSAKCMACIQKQGCKGARNWKVSCAAECSATTPAPAPRTTTPAPRKVEPAPRKVEPAPRKVEPAPRKVEPAPRKVEPAPRKVEPAPRKVEPAPRKVEPAPRKVEPAPRKAEPAPRKAAPTTTNTTPAPKTTEAMTPAKFCSLVTSESLRCLNVKLEQFKADPQKARSVQFFKMVIEKFKKDRKKNVNRCVTQFAKHQKKRSSQGKAALTSQHLQNCWNCFKKAGCSRNSRKACAPVCTGK